VKDLLARCSKFNPKKQSVEVDGQGQLAPVNGTDSSCSTTSSSSSDSVGATSPGVVASVPRKYGKARRNVGHPSSLLEYLHQDQQTLYEMFQVAVKKYPNNSCLGTRKIAKGSVLSCF